MDNIKIKTFKEFLNEAFAAGAELSISELKKLQTGDEFTVHNEMALNNCVVLTNTSKELTYKVDIPGIGWQRSIIIYKLFNEIKKHYFHKSNNTIYRFYSK
jgi:hypothetical protein